MSFDNVVNNGNYFFPAWKHYGNKNLAVNCDRCNKSNLQACIGYGEIDLCLNCVDILTNNKQIKPIVFIEPPKFIPPPYLPPFGPHGLPPFFRN